MLKILILFILLSCANVFASVNDLNLQKYIISNELNLFNIALSELLDVLNKENNIAITATDDIKDLNIDIFFPAGENLENILNTILKIYNLKLSSSGKVYILSKNETSGLGEFSLVGKIYDKDHNFPLTNVKVTLINSFTSSTYSSYSGNFILRNIIPGIYIAKFEKNGYIPKSTLVNLEKSNTSIKVNMEKDMKFKHKKNKKVDFFSQVNIINSEEISTATISLNSGNCDEIKNVLEKNFADLLKIQCITKKGLIVLTGKKDLVESSVALIKNLDKEEQQIQITSQILDVTDNLFENLGFTWLFNHVNNSSSLSKRNNLNLSLLNNMSIAGIGTLFGSAIGITRQFNNGSDILNLGINLLESTQDLVVSARPSILVVNGEEGIFKVTEEVIVGEEKSENDNNNKTIYTPIFKEAGIILKVIPYIKKDGYILLKINIEVSNFKLRVNNETKGSESNGTYNSEGGSKVSRSITTSVKVKDGETIFIGGLKKATVHNLNSKIPYLGKTPIVGFLFKNQGISHETSDIYVKLKVDVIKDETTHFENDEIHDKMKKIQEKKIY